MLDYEKLPASKRLSVQIEVVDNGQPPLSYTETIVVQIVDVNEVPSNIRLINMIGAEIPENVTIGKNIGELFADNPEETKQQLEFFLLNWNETFAVERVNNQSFLSTKKELDYDYATGYNLTVEVTDNGIPPLTAQGFVGIEIQRTDPCASGLLNCSERVVCQRINKTNGNCGCIDGYFRKDYTCEELNECNANCTYCEDTKKACSAKEQCLPCDNNGTCIDQLNAYQCSCLPGFSDARCKTNIDECASTPCQNGTCHDLVNNYRCQCYAGYAGRNCEININECKKNECIKGNCIDLVAGFYCSCQNGYSGLLCNRRKNDCAPSKCGNDLCVPPSYNNNSIISQGDVKAVCAKSAEVVILKFSSWKVPEEEKEQSKWKYLLREFITEKVQLPFDAVGLSEAGSNGGFYTATDVIFYSFTTGRKRRNINNIQDKINLPFVVKVQEKIIPQDPFLRAANISCGNVGPSSAYWTFCNASFDRIEEIGLFKEFLTEDSVEKANIYIAIVCAIIALLLLAMIILVLARQQKVKKEAKLNALTKYSDSTSKSYDKLERMFWERSNTKKSFSNIVYENPQNVIKLRTISPDNGPSEFPENTEEKIKSSPSMKIDNLLLRHATAYGVSTPQPEKVEFTAKGKHTCTTDGFYAEHESSKEEFDDTYC